MPIRLITNGEYMNGAMSNNIINKISVSRGMKKLSANGVSKLRSEVKEVMWKYYSVNKLNLPDYIGEFREKIIIELMKGEDVEDVFNSVLEDEVLRVA
jgi:hypothetical protein